MLLPWHDLKLKSGPLIHRLLFDIVMSARSSGCAPLSFAISLSARADVTAAPAENVSMPDPALAASSRRLPCRAPTSRAGLSSRFDMIIASTRSFTNRLSSSLAVSLGLSGTAAPWHAAATIATASSRPSGSMIATLAEGAMPLARSPRQTLRSAPLGRHRSKPPSTRRWPDSLVDWPHAPR